MTPIDVPVHRILLEAVGYRGQARFVALYFGSGDESYYSDGQVSATGDPHAYLAYIRHPACLVALAPFDLGSSDFEAQHWLVLDRKERRAYLAPVAEARRFLREQWQESPAGPVVLSEGEWQAVMERLRHEMASRPMPTPAEVMAALQEQHRLHRELVAWLDATPQAAAGRAAIRRMVEGEKGTGEAEEEA